MRSVAGAVERAGLPAAAALLLLLWAALGWPWLSGAVTIPWDAKSQFYPQLAFLARSLGAGETPFWTSNVFAGSPQIADPQSLIFAPPFLLLAALVQEPGFRAMDSVVLGLLLLGGLAILLYGRDRGWAMPAMVLAAIMAGFGGSAAWRLQHIGQIQSLVGFLWTLVLLERALGRGAKGYGLAAGIVGGFMLLGRDQVALLGAYLLTIRVLWHWHETRRVADTILPLAIGAAGGIAVIALPVVATALLADVSNRPAIDLYSAGAGSLHPALLLTTLVPDLFGAGGAMADYWGPPSFPWTGTGLFIAQNMGVIYAGAIPLLLLIMGASRGDLWAPPIRFVTAALLVVLVFALGWYTPAFELLYELPGIKLYRRPADATFLAGALWALLTGHLANEWLQGRLPAPNRSRQLLEMAIPVGALLAATGLAISFGRLPQAGGALLLGAATFAAASLLLLLGGRWRSARPMLVGLALLGFTAADLAIANAPNGATGMAPDYWTALDPRTDNATIRWLKTHVVAEDGGDRRDRIELAGLGYPWPNSPLVHDLEHTLGHNPVRLDIYTKATGAMDTIAVPDQRKFPPAFPSWRSPLADLLGLRFIVTPTPIETIDKQLSPGDLPLRERTADGYIYENVAALPRALVATRWQRQDFEALLRDGSWPEVDYRRTVLLEAPPDGNGTDAEARATLVRYGHEEIVVDAESSAPGFLVLHDVYHPWWYAELDGAPAPILRANGIFRAVAMPTGRHRVEFRFRPFRGMADELARRWSAARSGG